MHTYIVILIGNIAGILSSSETPKLGSHVNVRTYSDNGSERLISGFISEVIN